MPIVPVISIDEDLPEAPTAPMADVHGMEEANNWAIVVYQPPVLRHAVELPVVPFGPPMPPDMVWRRTCENLLQAPLVFDVPKHIILQPMSPVILSNRSWDFAFREMDLPLLT